MDMIEEKLFTVFNLLRMNEIQLNALQLTILFYIAKNDGKIRLSDISTDLTISFTTVQRVCDALEKGYLYSNARNNTSMYRKGCKFIQRVNNPKDQRSKLLAITKEGKNYISSFTGTMKRNGGIYYEHGQTTEIRETARGL